MTAPVRYVIVPPNPGRFVLACRCGQVLHADTMHRYIPAGQGRGNTAVLRPICCLDCATAYEQVA